MTVQFLGSITGHGLPDALKACTDIFKSSSEVLFSVFPNVLKPGVPKNVSFALLNSDDFTKADLCIFSVDGLLVWKAGKVAKFADPVIATWQCQNRSGKKVASGVYLVVLEYKGKIYRKKILIAG